MAVNHQHLRAFHAVASEGGFSSAARRLNISQPTLSQQIKALESRYGTLLFEGRRRPLRLTPVGRELLNLTGRMFATSDEIEELLGDRPTGDPRQVRLAADSPIYAARLAQLLMAEGSRLTVEVQLDHARGALQRLLDGRAEVGIISDPPIDPRLVYRPLFIDRLAVILSAGHVRAGEEMFALGGIARETLLLREQSSKTRAAIESMLHARDIAPARIVELHGRETIREAVALGLGVSFMFSAECPPDPRLAVLLPDSQPDSALLTGYLVFRADKRKTSLMRQVMQSAERLEEFSPVPLAGYSDRRKAATSGEHGRDRG